MKCKEIFRKKINLMKDSKCESDKRWKYFYIRRFIYKNLDIKPTVAT